MSLKLKKSLITILTAFVLLFASAAMFIAPNMPTMVNAAVIEAQVEGVESNYMINAKETFPVSITSPVSAGEGVVIYPNGKAYKITENKEFVLNVAGEYTLRYYGEDQVLEKSFVVSQKHFVLSSDEVAGRNEIVMATQEVMADEVLPNGENFPNRSDWPNISQNLTTLRKDGLIVRMESGTKFTYSVPIDLSKAGEGGLTDIITFQPRYGDYDKSRAGSSANYAIADAKAARNIIITLTDCYDSSRYMRYIVQEGGDTNYSRAGTDNLLDAGWVFPTTRIPTSDMSYRDFYEGTEYGFAYIGQYGCTPAGNQNEWVRRDAIHLKFDYQNAKVWATSFNTSGTGDYQETMVADFMNKSVFPTNDYRGFTTGEVYLSIEFNDYQAPLPARVDIFEIAGQKVDALFEMRTADETNDATVMTKDVKAPLINIDFTSTRSEGVFVDVGSEFVLPTAKVYDVNIKGDLNVTAYRNYTDEEHRINVPIVDGKLTVSEPDTYTLVYSAKDTFGNEAQKILKVFGIKDDSNPAVEFSYGEKLADLKAGELNVLPKFTFNTRNISDLRTLKITATSSKETVVIADLKNGQQIDDCLSKDVSFMLGYAGEYTITYVYADNAGEKAVSYTVNSSASDIVSIPYAPAFPKYFIKDAIYDFEEVYAYSYITGSQEPYKKADIYIAYDEDVNEANVAESVFTKLNGALSNKVTGSEKAVLKYAYESSVIYSSVIEIVDTNIAQLTKLKQYKYFVGDFATANPDDETFDGTLFNEEVYNPIINGRPSFDTSKLDYKSKVLEGENTLSFINTIDLNKFSFYFRIVDDADPRIDADNFNALKLVFTDPYNPANQVYAKIYKLNDTVYFDLNNESTLRVNQAFAGNFDKYFTYNKSTGVFNVSGATANVIFDFGFTTTKAYLDIVFEDISGVAGIRILELNGHKFSHDGRARTLPTSLMVIPQGNYSVGTKIKIPAAEFVDVLSPIVKENVSIKVQDPNGDVVTALDGTPLDGTCDPYKEYEIIIDVLGQYKISYSATSGINQRSTPPGFITVGDLVAPEITFEGDIYEGCVLYLKPNQKFEVKYTVSDDISLPENLFSRIIWTNRTLSCATLIQGNVICFPNEGEYEVGVSCFDELNNYSRKTFTVIVTNEEVK